MLPALCLALLMTAQVDTRGLSNAQIAELQLKAEEMKGGTLPSKSEIKEYAELGQAVGTAIASTAKELGVAAEEFSHTNVGKITIFLIAWQLVGEQVIQAIVGSCLLIVSIFLWSKYFKRMCVISKEEYYENRKLKSITYQPVSDALHGTRFIMGLALLILIGISMVVIFA